MSFDNTIPPKRRGGENNPESSSMSPPPKTGELSGRKMRGIRTEKAQEVPKPKPPPKPQPSLPLTSLKIRTPKIETDKPIERAVEVTHGTNTYHFGVEKANTIATLNLSLDQQKMQYAYWADEMNRLTPENQSRFLEALAGQAGQSHPLIYPEYRNDERKLDIEGQKRMDLIFYGIVHATEMIDRIKYHLELKSEYIKSSTTRIRGQDHAPSVLVNARYQTFTNPHHQTLEVFRTGALYDFRDPGNTVSELEAYLDAIKANKPEQLDEEINSREKELRSFEEGSLLKLSRPSKDNKKADAIRNSLIPLYMLRDFRDGSSSIYKLISIQRVIEEKKRFIDDQMVQMIMVQVSHNLNHFEGDKFTLVYDGLLNELKSGKDHVVDESGLIMDEGKNILEMKDAFHRFQGKKLIFDKTGPYQDRSGNVHLPYVLPHRKTLDLECVYFNFTVNGSEVNNPLQKEVNDEAIHKMKKILDKLGEKAPQLTEELYIRREYIHLDSQLKNKDSNFKMASSLLTSQFLLRNLMNQHQLGCFAIGAGCYSAKDRTAIAIELAMTQAGVDPLLKQLDLPSKEKTEIREKLIDKITDEEGLSAEIAFQNTGSRTIKYLAFFLPGQSQHFMDGAAYKIKQIGTVLNPIKPQELD